MYIVIWSRNHVRFSTIHLKLDFVDENFNRYVAKLFNTHIWCLQSAVICEILINSIAAISVWWEWKFMENSISSFPSRHLTSYAAVVTCLFSNQWICDKKREKSIFVQSKWQIRHAGIEARWREKWKWEFCSENLIYFFKLHDWYKLKIRIL